MSAPVALFYSAVLRGLFMQLVLIELAPQLVIAAVRACRARLVHPVLSADDYLAVLARRELPETAAFLRANNAEI